MPYTKDGEFYPSVQDYDRDEEEIPEDFFDDLFQEEPERYNHYTSCGCEDYPCCGH